MLATIAQVGPDGWLDYWQALKDNGLKVVSGWEDAYYTEFSGPSSAGTRPIVVSYASSPPSEVPDGATTPATEALLDTCFRQVEYTGVLKGAANPAGAQAFVDFMLSEDVQASLPTTMWVYPVKEGITLPQDWADFAPMSPHPLELSPGEIAQNRETWTKEWIETALG
jgi:thiamine transport system substrate-binding protein